MIQPLQVTRLQGLIVERGLCLCLAVIAVAMTHTVAYARCMVHVRSRCMVISGSMVAASVDVYAHARVEDVAGAQAYKTQSRCADDDELVHCCLCVVVNNRNV